jgi:hypothetical protein
MKLVKFFFAQNVPENVNTSSILTIKKFRNQESKEIQMFFSLNFALFYQYVARSIFFPETVILHEKKLLLTSLVVIYRKSE